MELRRHLFTGLLVITALPSVALGQDELPSVASVLEDFRVNTEDASVSYPSAKYRTAAWVAQTILYSDRYSVARVDSVLDGLQELASSAPVSNTRRHATVWLLSAGTRDYQRGLTGVVRRLEGVYRSAPSTRRLIILGMPEQAEANDALLFLREVVAEGDGGHSFMAMAALMGMGAPGRSVLQELVASGAVTGSSRAEVERLLDQGPAPAR